MQLSHFPHTYREKYTPEFWHTFLSSRLGLTGFPKNAFNYIDGTTFIDVSQREYDEMNHTVKSVNAIFQQAYTYYYEDITRNLPEFIALHPLFRESFPQDEYFIARYDILMDENGTLKFLETNANTPGMVCESHLPAEMLTPEGYMNQSKQLVEYTKQWWRERREKYGWKTLAIFTAYAHENEDYFVCRSYMDILSEVFGEENIFIGDVFDMNIVDASYITLKGERIDAILSYFPIEFFLTDVDFALGFFEIISSGGCFLTNPLESMILQDKLIFAVIWENIEKYSQKDQQIIKKHIPYTSREFQEDSGKYIAKWRFGRYGREIYTERFYTNIEDTARYIYQEKITPKTVDDAGSFLVLSAYTDMQNPISWISRKQEHRTTDDTFNGVTLLYHSSNYE